LRPEDIVEVFRSNDRRDLHIGARFMLDPQYSFRDLAFLVADDPETTQPHRFLVFCNSTEDTEEGCIRFAAMWPEQYRSRFAWFHSDMSAEYRATTLERFRKGELWGLFCTDAFGMVCLLHLVRSLPR
jgi:superfamily II DNA/RNA helicase